MEKLGDDTKAQVVLATLKYGDGRRLMTTLRSSVVSWRVSEALGGSPKEENLRCFLVAAERAETDLEAARLLMFLREAREDRAVGPYVADDFLKAEGILLDRFPNPEMEQTTLTVEVMES